MSRLFRQDRLIAWNTACATFADWRDRVIAALLLVAAFAAVRAWFADRPWTVAAWAALVASAVIGIGAGRFVAMHLAFHASDGLLATDALRPRERRRYVARWHGVGLALQAVVTLIARPSLLVVSVPAYIAGALIAGLAGGLAWPRRIARTVRPGWTFREWSRRPNAGMSAAAILLLSLLLARTLGRDALMAVVGIETLLLALMLTGVDDAVVRFMAIAGHGSRRMIVYYAKGIAAFLAAAVLESWIMLGPVAAGIAAVAGAALLLLLTLRVLAYRLHAKRFADLLVSILAGLLLLAAYSMPIALPVVVPAMLWYLHRRGRTRTWLLA